MSRSFCSVSNSAAQDKNLTLEAIGLYFMIQSCIEDLKLDYDHFKSAMMARCKESNDTFDSAWEELNKAGYLKQLRISHSTPSCETLVIRGRTE